MMHGGALLPLGADKNGSGHKGYCLAGMVDVLSAVLSGANWGPFTIPFAIDSAPTERQVGKGIGHFFGAMDIEGFRAVDEFKSSIDDWIHTMRNTAPIPGTIGVIIPGDPEREAYKIRMEKGIPLHEDVVAALENISSYIGVKLG